METSASWPLDATAAGDCKAATRRRSDVIASGAAGGASSRHCRTAQVARHSRPQVSDSLRSHGACATSSPTSPASGSAMPTTPASPPASPRSCSTSRPSASGRRARRRARHARDRPARSRIARWQQIDAIVLSGGSAFGLDAASGVQALAARARAAASRSATSACRSCAGAIAVRPAQRRRQELGPLPALSRSRLRRRRSGRRSISSSAPPARASARRSFNLKGGLGSASAVTREGHHRRRDRGGQRLRQRHRRSEPRISGRRRSSRTREFGGRGLPPTVPPEALRSAAKGRPGENTTHRAGRDRRRARQGAGQQLAVMAQDGLARAIYPVHTTLDGDIVFAAATGTRPLKAPVSEAERDRRDRRQRAGPRGGARGLRGDRAALPGRLAGLARPVRNHWDNGRSGGSGCLDFAFTMAR